MLVVVQLVTFGVALIEGELAFKQVVGWNNPDDWSQGQAQVQWIQPGDDPLLTAMRVVIMILTIISMCLIVQYQRTDLHIKKINLEENWQTTLWDSKQRKKIIMEIFIHMLFPQPGLNTTLKQDVESFPIVDGWATQMTIMMQFRVQLILRWQIWRNEQLQDRYKQVCLGKFCKSGPIFSLKAINKDKPFLLWILLWLMFVIVFGLSLRRVEKPFIHWSCQDQFQLWNGWWCIIITMTTVGQGDMYATTSLGQGICAVSAVIGVILLSQAIVLLNVLFGFTQHQLLAYNAICQKRDKDKLPMLAARFIQYAQRITHEDYNTQNKLMKAFIKFKKSMTAFKSHRNLISSNLYCKSHKAVVNEMAEFHVNISINFIMDEIKSYKDSVNKLNECIKSSIQTENFINQINTLLLEIETKLEDIKTKKDDLTTNKK